MDDEKSTHDKLVDTYLEYFKYNELWHKRRSVRMYYATQKNLKKIKRLAKQLELENKEIFKNRPRPRRKK